VASRAPGLAAAAKGRREQAEERRRRRTPRPEPGAAAAEAVDAGVVEAGVTMVAGGCFSDARRGHVNEEGQSMRQGEVAYWRDTWSPESVGCKCGGPGVEATELCHVSLDVFSLVKFVLFF
jgi:hypothetical protein